MHFTLGETADGGKHAVLFPQHKPAASLILRHYQAGLTTPISKLSIMLGTQEKGPAVAGPFVMSAG
jgi:hypothetical protein